MVRRSARVCAGLLVMGLVAALLAVPAGAAAPSAAQGVTKGEVQIVVLFPDIDALKAKGIQSRSSNEGFLKRFTTYSDAYGSVNGRKLAVKGVTWDPIDPTSYDKACTAATIDNKPFVVVNGTGFNTSAVPCIAIDNKTPFMIGDPASDKIRKAAGKNLVTLREPVEVLATNSANIIAKGKLIPKTAKIGILSNNEPSLKASGDTLAKVLKKNGYNVASKVEINGLSSDLGVISREAAAAVDTFKAAGVDTMINNQSFQAVRPFFQTAERSNVQFKYLAIDTQANECSPSGSGAPQLPAVANGLLCITPYSYKALPNKSGLVPDSTFEAKCRKDFDVAIGKPSTPGAQSGGLVDANGVVYNEDFPSTECNMANVLLPAIKKAGKDLTWDKVYANIMATTKASAAYLSEGQGGFGKNKPYFPMKVHVVSLNYASSSTPKDANGTFSGCPVPASCWVPTQVNGQEWFTLTS